MVSLKPRHFLLLKGGRSRIKGQRKEKKEPVRPSSRLPLAIIFVIPGFRPNRVPRLPVFTTAPPPLSMLAFDFRAYQGRSSRSLLLRSKWKKRPKYNYKRDPVVEKRFIRSFFSRRKDLDRFRCAHYHSPCPLSIRRHHPPPPVPFRIRRDGNLAESFAIYDGAPSSSHLPRLAREKDERLYLPDWMIVAIILLPLSRLYASWRGCKGIKEGICWLNCNRNTVVYRCDSSKKNWFDYISHIWEAIYTIITARRYVIITQRFIRYRRFHGCARRDSENWAKSFRR